MLCVYLIYMHIHRPDTGKCRKREMLGNYLLLLLLRFFFSSYLHFTLFLSFRIHVHRKQQHRHRAWCTDWKTVIRLMHLFAACHKNAQHNTHKLHDRNLFECVFFSSIFASNAYLFLFVLSLFMQQQHFIFYGDKNYNAQAMKFIRLRRRSQNITVNEMPI